MRHYCVKRVCDEFFMVLFRHDDAKQGGSHGFGLTAIYVKDTKRIIRKNSIYRYIAEENARSANREIEMLIRQRIKEYESNNGEIVFENISK